MQEYKYVKHSDKQRAFILEKAKELFLEQDIKDVSMPRSTAILRIEMPLHGKSILILTSRLIRCSKRSSWIVVCRPMKR